MKIVSRRKSGNGSGILGRVDYQCCKIQRTKSVGTLNQGLVGTSHKLWENVFIEDMKVNLVISSSCTCHG